MPMWKARYRHKKTCNLIYTSISMLCVYYEVYLNKLKINTEKNDLPHNSTDQTFFFQSARYYEIFRFFLIYYISKIINFIMYSTLTYTLVGSFCIYVFQRVNNLNILVIIRSYSLQTVICTCM